MIDGYPRVLIVGTPFNLENGGGITLSNLFRDWPPENLAVACARESFPKTDRAGHLYRLGGLEDRWIWPLDRIPRDGKRSGPVVPSVCCAHAASESPGGSLGGAKRIARAVFHVAVDLMGVEPLARRLQTSGRLLNWCQGFDPQVIYSQLSNLGLIEFVLELSKMKDLPVVLHFMDDWPAVIYRQGLLSPIVRRRMHGELSEVIRRASAALGISQEMCEAFAQRYGRPFEPFHNAVDLQNWSPLQKRDWASHSPFRLMYRGRIGTATKSSLADVCAVVSEINSSSDRLSFEIVTPDLNEVDRLRLRRFKGVRARGPVPYARLPQEMAAADLFVVPLDFDAISHAYARYSMPTKVVEYMASGTPSLVYGPGNTALVRYSLEGGWAYVVSKRDRGALRSAIARLAEDQGMRENLGRAGLRLAALRHDAVGVREAFRRVLVAASGSDHAHRGPDIDVVESQRGGVAAKGS